VAFSTPVVVPEDGFIYIWLSNESEGTEVWFDDLSIRHTQTLVAQATDYGVWGEVLREQRADARKYRFGYQGQYAEKDEETGWNHFDLREYDPIIGRWTSVDPKRVGFSPYIGMGNNPVNSVDPDGGEFLDIIFQNNDCVELGRIITGNDNHEYVNVDTYKTLENPIIIDPLKLLGMGKRIDAVGFGIDGSFALGGGLNIGKEWVYFLRGPYQGELFSYNRIGGNLGFELSGGVYGFMASFFDPIQFLTPQSWEGMSNSYSGGVIASGGYFWSNEKGTSELYPWHKGAPLWKGVYINASKGVMGFKWSSTQTTLSTKVSERGGGW
jgi:RHS repeat-associated protein